MPIHPTAVIDARAQIDASADIGPYVVIDGPVVVGARTCVHAHAVLMGRTTMGSDNVVHAGAVIGDVPQDLGWADRNCGVRIGSCNVFREHSQVHCATQPDGNTVLGDHNYLMVNAHVGHDCELGDHIILANAAALGGHVHVGDRAFISANCVVHQFVRVGRLALMRGLSRTSRDVPPFCMMDETHTVRGINRVGLRRAGLSSEQVRAVHRAFAQLFRTRRNLRLAMADVETQPRTAEVDELLQFIRDSRRGVAFGPRAGEPRPAEDD